MMRQQRLRVLETGEPFGLDALTFGERMLRAPERHEIVIRLAALSLNFRDLLVIGGVDRWRPTGRRIPISDGAGVVVELGSAARRFSIGERVVPIFYPAWIDGGATAEKVRGALGGAVADGLAAEYAIVSEEAAVRTPAALTDEECATLPCAGVTAWNAIAGATPPRSGDVVVVLGTGGVALYALQFARLFDARVIITSSSVAKLSRAREIGADEGVNYHATPNWPAAVLEMTGGRGADLVVDTVGDLEPAIEAVRVGGTVAYVGLLRGTRCEVDLVRLMGRSAVIRAIDVGSRDMFDRMNQAIASAGLRPVIDRTFTFDQAVEAFRFLSDRGHFGKVCIRIP